MGRFLLVTAGIAEQEANRLWDKATIGPTVLLLATDE
jgi:hypothetical protein